MKFREGNYALYCEGDNTELCRIVKVCSTDTYKVVFDDDGKLLLTQHVKPVPINECDIERLGFSLYSKSSGYRRFRTSKTDDEGDVLTDYERLKARWLYENLPSSTCVSVRYIHEVQNLMEVLNDL